tara:strand:+ start:474 stop:899 length:426 start_codon:yes stop_codon:yes gene_type:complete
MEQFLTKDQMIYLLLLFKINEPQLCCYIIGLKNKKERIEAYNYHYENWEKIASKYFKCLENRYPTYSYILNDKEIIAKQDNNLIFFKETGISYQIRDLIMNLISDYKDDNISKEEKKIWRKEDDKKYSKLARRIQDKMKYL